MSILPRPASGTPEALLARFEKSGLYGIFPGYRSNVAACSIIPGFRWPHPDYRFVIYSSNTPTCLKIHFSAGTSCVRSTRAPAGNGSGPGTG